MEYISYKSKNNLEFNPFYQPEIHSKKGACANSFLPQMKLHFTKIISYHLIVYFNYRLAQNSH